MNILQAIGRDAEAVGKWIGKELTDVEVKVAPVLVSAIEAIRTAEADGVLPAISKALSPITGGLSVTINNDVEAGIPGALAAALGIEALPADKTAEQLTAFGQSVITAIAGQNAAVKGAPYTKTVAQFIILLQTSGATPGGQTLGKTITDVEEAYADMEQNIADAAAGVDVTSN